MKLPKQSFLLPVLFAGSSLFGCGPLEIGYKFPQVSAHQLGDDTIYPARSVRSAAPDAVHLSEEIDSRRAFDTRARHPGFEFVRGDECARLFQTFPFEEQGEVVDVFSAVKDTASALAIFAPPVEAGIERRLPGRIVGDFVMDENVDHDGGAIASR